MDTPSAQEGETRDPRDRLESWKEIAAYLNRSERTVRRWEDQEGLPVHRLAHAKRSSVYAFPWELDAWRDSRRQIVDAEPLETELAMVPRSRRAWAIAAVIAAAVLAGFGIWLTKGPSETPAQSPDPEAERLVKLASFVGNAGRRQIETGIRYFQDAIRRDAGYAAAWSGLATAHLVQIWFGEVLPADRLPQVRREAEEALRLDPSSGDAWRVLAMASHFFEWDHPEAERLFRRAMESSPTDAASLSWYADCLLNLRRFDEARTYYRRAQEVAPRWLEPIAFLGNAHLFSGHADLAIAEYTRVLESEPNFGLGNHFLGRAHVSRDEHEKGITLLRKSNELLGEVPFSLADLGHALAVGGRREEAEALRDDLVRRRTAGYYPAYPIAVIELGLGNTETALDWLELATDERNIGFYLPSVDLAWDPVQAHPRFAAILERAKLPARTTDLAP